MKPVRVQKSKPKKQLKHKKERKPKRWLLNAFLYLLLFYNGMMVLLTFAALAYQSNPKTTSVKLFSPEQYSYGLVLALISIFFLINLLQLRRWAFWGYCLTTVGVIFLNISIGTKISVALLGFGAPILLFGLLYMGGRRSAWREMDRDKIKSKPPSKRS